MKAERIEPRPVAVLMALFQGERFVSPQLQSIADQSHANWRLIIGDDGSDDKGPQRVRDFASRHPGRVSMQKGPGRGAAANFLTLLESVRPGEFAAFADQDDVWHREKLSRAVEELGRHPANRPAIYCGRVAICSEDLRPLGASRLPRRPPSFRHALVQNLVQGNTLVMNPAAVALVRRANRCAGPVVMHDWWVYLLITGAGGTVVFDPRPSLFYRQHGQNVIGARTGLDDRGASLLRMLRGGHRRWSLQNLAALSRCADLLLPQNRQVLFDFETLVCGSLLQRMRALHRGGFYRQRRTSQAAFWLAATLGRV